MDLELAKKALINADRKAQAGDTKAKADAEYLAKFINDNDPYFMEKASDKRAEEESIGKRALGGAAAASDFITGMASLPLAGIAGVVGGIQDKVTGKGDFLPGAVRRIEEVQKATNLGELTGLAQGEGYQAAQGVLGLPAEAGIKASRGIGALTRLPFQGLQGAVEHLEHPERSPLSSTIEDVEGTFLGYGLAGPIAKRGGQAIAKVDPTLRNIKAKKPADLTPEELQARFQASQERAWRQADEEQASRRSSRNEEPIQYPKKDDLSIVPEMDTETVVGRRSPGPEVVRSNRTGERMYIPEEQGDRGIDFGTEDVQGYGRNPLIDEGGLRSPYGESAFLEGAELPPDATRTRPFDKSKGAFEQRQQADMANLQAEENARATDFQARREEFGPDRNPQDLALDYDPFGLKDLEKSTESPKPAPEGIDYETLPETVNKDFVLQNKLKRFEELKARLGEVAAKELTLKQDEGPSYYPNTEINEKFQREFKKEQDKLQKNIENLKKEIDTRLRNEHGWSYPSLEGPKQPYSRSIYTRQRGQVFKTPDMQRSSEARITGGDKVVKTNRHPLGGVGKKQGGAIDPEVFTKLFPEFIKSIFKDADGKLIPLYHGTSKDKPFDKFKKSSRGTWLTTDPEAASSYAKQNDSQKHVWNPETRRLEDVNTSAHVHQVYANAEKIYQMTEAEKAEYHRTSNYAAFQRKLTAKAAAEGYDAIDYGGGVYAIINPENIKSAISGDSKAPLGSKRIASSQRGSIDPSVFGEGLAKILSTGKAIGKSTFSMEPRPNKPTKELRGKEQIYALTGSDPRDIPTFVSDVLKDKANLKDIDDPLSPRGLMRKGLPPSAVGKLSARYNPLVSYHSHVMDKIDGAVRFAKETAVWGKTASNNWRGKPSMVKSDDGALTIIHGIKRGRQETFRTTVMKYMDGKLLTEEGLDSPSNSMLMADGLSPREIQGYRAMEKQFNTLLDRVNEMGAKVNKEKWTPIRRIPGYFPGVWLGDYRAFVKDKEGNNYATLAFDHPYELKQLEAQLPQLESQHGVKGLFIEESDVSANKYTMKDTSAFQLALDVFPADTPLGKALEQARNDIVKHRGFRKHGLQKKGVYGSLGSGKGDFSGMVRASEIYFEQGYNFLGDMQKKLALSELRDTFAKNDYSLEQNLKNTNRYLDDITANSIGSVENMWKGLDAVLEVPMEVSGRMTGIGGRSSAKRTIRGLNALANIYNLVTMKQPIVNAMQPLYALPKAMQIKARFGSDVSITSNFTRALTEAFVPGYLSVESRSALTYARNTGMIDARTLDLINGNAGQAKSIIGKGIGATSKGFGHLQSWWEQEVVRVPVYLFFNHMLKGEILETKARHEAAAQMTSDYMVNYSKTQTPMIYSQMGLLGEAARPYQQFTHNYQGQLLEFTQETINNKDARPLAAFMGVQWTMAGLLGLIPLAGGVTAAVKAYNAFTDDPVPTPEEVLMSSGQSNVWTWGPASVFTGLNLTSSAGAPNIFPTPGMPGVSLATSLGKDVGGLAVDAMQGTADTPSKMKAAMTATPSALKGLVQEHFAGGPDKPIPNPRRDMVPDLPRPRTSGERFIKNWLGADPLSEAIPKAKIRKVEEGLKKLNAKEQKYINKFVDDYVSTGETNEKMLAKLKESGTKPSEVISAIKSKIKDRALGRLESQLFKKGIRDKKKMLDLMDKYDLELSDLSIAELADRAREE